MATTVREVMNPELFFFPPAMPTERASGLILSMGITAVPVIDDEGAIQGVVSLRDLVDSGGGKTVQDCMSSPAFVMAGWTTLDVAATRLSDENLHHAVVVDEGGGAVGFVSALDVMRGLAGIPASHPPAFPHWDKTTDLYWSDDATLAEKKLDEAPDGPGLFVLVHGGRGNPETVIWVESAANVRSRLLDILATPRSQLPGLAAWLASGSLRFRAAACDDAMERDAARVVVEARMRARRTF